MGELVPPDPPLAGRQVALRPFRVSDAAAIAESCRDPDIPRFTMMPEAMTKDLYEAGPGVESPCRGVLSWVGVVLISLWPPRGEDQVWWENSPSGPIQRGRAVKRPDSWWDLLERRVPPW